MLLKGKGKIKVNESANGGLSDSVCHWSKVNIGVSCGEFPINIKLFSYITFSKNYFLAGINFGKIQSADFSHRLKLLMEVRVRALRRCFQEIQFHYLLHDYPC